MTRKLTAAIAAAAVALTSMIATPAAAISDEDALKLLLGALAVGVIVQNLNDNNNRRAPSRSHYSPRGRVIPGECVFDIRTRRGPKEVVGERCVARSGFRAELPSACAIDIRGDRRDRTVYGVNCLRERGFRIGAARY